MAMTARYRSLLVALFLLSVVASPKDAWSAGKRPVVTISKETTYITEPLRPDGYPDYLAALNQRMSKGVTPENNAAVALLQAFGPNPLNSGQRDGLLSSKSQPGEYREKFYKMLRIAPLRDRGDYFVDYDDYIKQHAPDALKEWDSAGHRYSSRDLEEFVRAGERPWPKEECPLVAGWLAANEKPLHRIVEASQRTRYYVPAILSGKGKWSASMGAAPAILALPLREATVRALRTRAMLRIHERKWREAWADLQTCHRLARLEVQGCVYESLLADYGDRVASCGDWQLAQFGRLTPAQADECRALLGRLPPWPSTAEQFGLEDRFTYLDSVCGVASGRAKPGNFFGETSYDVDHQFSVKFRLLGADGAFSISSDDDADTKWVARGRVDWNELLRLGNRHFDSVMAITRKPTWSERNKAWRDLYKRLMKEINAFQKDMKTGVTSDRTDAAGKAAKQMDLTKIASAYFLVSFRPGYEVLDEPSRATRAKLAEMAFALRAYRGRHGRYPKDLSELVPKYLARLPEDPFGSGPLQYRGEEDQCILYSVSLNGVDDTASKPFSEAVSELEASTRSGGDDDLGFVLAEVSELERIAKEEERHSH
jgi:hypothetical protein